MENTNQKGDTLQTTDSVGVTETQKETKFSKDDLALAQSSISYELDYLIRNRVFSDRRKRLVELKNRILEEWMDMEEAN